MVSIGACFIWIFVVCIVVSASILFGSMCGIVVCVIGGVIIDFVLVVLTVCCSIAIDRSFTVSVFRTSMFVAQRGQEQYSAADVDISSGARRVRRGEGGRMCIASGYSFSERCA